MQEKSDKLAEAMKDLKDSSPEIPYRPNPVLDPKGYEESFNKPEKKKVPDKSTLVTVRGAEAGDIPFIFSTMLQGLYYDKDGWFGEIPKGIFMDNYHHVIEQLLMHPSTRVAVACDPTKPDVIRGYSIYSADKPVLHWVFIKKAWRGIGIAKDLIPNNIKEVTHITQVGLSIIKKHGIVFNPFNL